MAVIFLLGPSYGDPDQAADPEHSPMQARRRIAQILGPQHTTLLMEDASDVQGEDMIQKFDRLLRHRVTDVLVYWPPRAKMQTTFDELILLCDRHKLLKRRRISTWVLYHASVASIQRNEFKVLEKGNRSRYLTAVARLGVHPLEWRDEADLEKRVSLLSIELLS